MEKKRSKQINISLSKIYSNCMSYQNKKGNKKATALSLAKKGLISRYGAMSHDQQGSRAAQNVLPTQTIFQAPHRDKKKLKNLKWQQPSALVSPTVAHRRFLTCGVHRSYFISSRYVVYSVMIITLQGFKTSWQGDARVMQTCFYIQIRRRSTNFTGWFPLPANAIDYFALVLLMCLRDKT